MSFRCVVVDDEKPARERVKRLLSEHRDFELVGEARNGDEAVRVIEETRPDLCFLDVQMPGGDGFDVLRRIDRVPGVIFTTAYDEYAVRAFEVHSLDYLLKPFGKARFAEALQRARETLGGADGTGRLLEALDRIHSDLRRVRSAEGDARVTRISGRRGNRVVLLDPEQVLCFEAEETLVFARTTEGRFLVERTLTDLERDLGGAYFRAHRRCLVRLGAIREIVPGDAGTYRIVLGDADGATVPLSRRQARKLRELIPW